MSSILFTTGTGSSMVFAGTVYCNTDFYCSIVFVSLGRSSEMDEKECSVCYRIDVTEQYARPQGLNRTV